MKLDLRPLAPVQVDGNMVLPCRQGRSIFFKEVKDLVAAAGSQGNIFLVNKAVFVNPLDTQAIPFVGALVIEGQAKLATAIRESRTRVEGLEFLVEILADNDLRELEGFPDESMTDTPGNQDDGQPDEKH